MRVTSADPPLRVECLLAEERPDVTSGYGGWDEITRPRRKPITTWKAPPSLHMTLPLMLDAHADGDSAYIEKQIAQVKQMGEPLAADGAPPRLTVTARGSAVPYTDRTWVVGEITWGDAIMDNTGNRTRQQVTLSLYEYVEDVYLTEKSAAKRRRNAAKVGKSKHGASAKRIQAKRGKAQPHAAPHALVTSTSTVGGGEDLLTIAAREYGDADRWVEIAKLNGLRDPRAIVPGQVLRLP